MEAFGRRYAKLKKILTQQLNDESEAEEELIIDTFISEATSNAS